MELILNPKLKYYTKEIFKYFNIGIIGIGLIIAIILIRYKPIYEVSIDGTEIGYVENKEAFKESLKETLVDETKNIDNIDQKSEPRYELKFVEKTETTNEEEVASKIEENTIITYKYYDIALDNQTVETVDTIEEAEEVVNQAKLENGDQDLNLSIIEKYTQNVEKLDAMPEINGIKIATKPVSGTITSRYGVSSKIRKSSHTGLDISAKSGTPIKAIASGTVTCAKYSGSYGNLVKIDHGNGVETWYAHTSKMYVKVGQKVEAGKTIAAVGSTGNSTGPHLHLEIRVNGKTVNPQKYLYN